MSAQDYLREAIRILDFADATTVPAVVGPIRSVAASLIQSVAKDLQVDAVPMTPPPARSVAPPRAPRRPSLPLQEPPSPIPMVADPPSQDEMQSIGPGPSTVGGGHMNRYNEYMSGATTMVRRLNPTKSHRENFKQAAALWKQVKHLDGDMNELVEAAKDILLRERVLEPPPLARVLRV